jgi:hypothetical protein
LNRSPFPDAIRAYYIHVDKLIGNLLAALPKPDKTAVLVVSTMVPSGLMAGSPLTSGLFAKSTSP